MVATTTGSYVWVTGSPDAPVPKKGDMRREIRRQAMSKVAADRRQRGNYGKSNIGQLPADVAVSWVSSRKSRNDAARQLSLHAPVPVPKERADRQTNVPIGDYRHLVNKEIPRSMSATGFERMRITYGFDLLDLSALTNFHVGQAAIKKLHNQPNRLVSVLRCRQWSYFSYLPQRYGHHQYLDDAVHCVAARIRQYVTDGGGQPQKDIEQMHLAALRNLQNALADPYQRLDPSVLCTCAILAIYELLQFPSAEIWTRHVEGAKALIRLRGPNAYNTEFEKALLMALTGPIFTESMLDVEPCFLEEQPWLDAMSGAVLETSTFADCSEIIVNLWARVVRLPRLLKDIEHVIQAPETATPQRIKELQELAEGLRSSFLTWKASYDVLVDVIAFRSLKDQVSDMFDRRFETLGIYLANMVMLSRGIAALDITRVPELEPQVTGFAQQAIALKTQLKTLNPRAYLFLVFKMIVVNAVLQTSAEWTDAHEMASIETSKLIPWPVFKRWSELKGRKTDKYIWK